MAARKIPVILYGLGPIGAACARLLATRPEYEFVGAIDVDPNKVGKDIADVIGLPEKTGVKVSDKTGRVLGKDAKLVVHATGSYFLKVKPQLEQIVKAGKNIVSTCEELANPWAQHPEAAEELNELAKKYRVTVVGTGINPGYAMDTLPVALTALCAEVKRIRVRRVVDASKRRVQLQRKIGTGLTGEAFREAVARREIRHVGLSESVGLIARGLGWTLDQIQEEIEPVIATKRVMTDFFTVEPNFVTGVRQWGRGLYAGEDKIILELEMAVDAAETYDEAWIEGSPDIHSLVKGIHGDISTAAVIANTARRVVEAKPGLLTMVDLPLVSAR
ncbi:MAG TPA: dihydrodipicolinate reductase [Anaerolineae bacterium]|nr:dihydrodipicolinate reductase [Anaerolineae bacterium]